MQDQLTDHLDQQLKSTSLEIFRIILRIFSSYQACRIFSLFILQSMT